MDIDKKGGYPRVCAAPIERCHPPSEGETPLTDAELIARSHDGEEDALVELLAKYERLVEFEAFASWLGYGVRATVADAPLQEVLKGEILEFLASQQAIYQDVVNLRIEGRTAPQIAEQLSLAEGTVKSRLNTFRRQLREYYLEEESSAS